MADEIVKDFNLSDDAKFTSIAEVFEHLRDVIRKRKEYPIYNDSIVVYIHPDDVPCFLSLSDKEKSDLLYRP